MAESLYAGTLKLSQRAIESSSDEELLTLWAGSARIFHHRVRYFGATDAERAVHYPIRDEVYRRGYTNANLALQRDEFAVAVSSLS